MYHNPSKMSSRDTLIMIWLVIQNFRHSIVALRAPRLLYHKRGFVRRGAATVIATASAHARWSDAEQLTEIIGALPLSARLPRAPSGRPLMDSVVQTHCDRLRSSPCVASILLRGVASLSGSG